MDRILWLLCTATTAASHIGSKLTIQIEDTTLQESCFATGCGKPKLRLSLGHGDADFAVDWPVNIGLLRLSTQPLPWHLVLPAALGNLSAAIAGTDLTYGFPRLCDAPPPLPLLLAPSETRQYTLEGKCFNVTVSVRRTDCCPTCELASGCCSRNPILIQEEDAGPLMGYSGVSLESQVPLWLAIALGGVCLLLLTAFIVLLSLCARAGRQKKLATYSSGSSGISKTRICRSLSQESKYEVPWDQKFRPLPDYVRQLNSAQASDRSSEGCYEN